jgi:hypothetical protein
MAAKAAGKFLGGLSSVNESGKRCLCEICEIYYAETQAGGRIAGFTNDGYREQYFENAGVNKRVYELIQLYFPRAQLFRGV